MADRSRSHEFYTRLVLAGGGLAWVIALAAVLLAGRSDPAPEPTRTAAAIRPTLAAASATPPPTATPTATPTASPTPTASLSATPSPTPSAPPTALPTQPPPTLAAVGASPVPSPTAPPTLDVSATAPPPPQPTTCPPPPDGWERYVVQPDDTLFAFVLGAKSSVTVDELMAANCLSSRYLALDEVLYLPPGAAANAPSSAPVAAGGGGAAAAFGGPGPRAANCPCTLRVLVGWRREQIAQLVQNSATLFTGADFMIATGPGASAPFDFAMQRPGGTSLEGFLYPGTYTVQNDTTAEQFRDMLLAQFAAQVSPQVRADAAAQGVSFYEALILASIVQRETRTPAWQGNIASILWNRLRGGSRLRSSVPLMYALGVPGRWWPPLQPGQVEIDSPYNTFIRGGLPPAPICSPDVSAITAAVYPPQTNYYYTSVGCDGKIVFSETYEQHVASMHCE